MGCDIHCFAERRGANDWECVSLDREPFDCRSYGMFGFLADVRNYSAVPPIAAPRGFPDDASGPIRAGYEEWGVDAHTPSWLTLEELLAFDYDAEVEDRRYTKQEGPRFCNGGATCEPGNGEKMPWREFLGEWFMKELHRLKDAGVERIVFWFDN